MMHAAAVVLVLSMSGLPAIAIVCDALCGREAAPAHAASCHEEPMSPEGPLIGAAAHACDHIISIAPFVIQSAAGGAFLPMPSAAADPLSIDYRAESVAGTYAASPPGWRLPLESFRVITLRI